MQPILSVSDLSKTYASGFQALKHVTLDIRPGEIFALLGPNGAGKTTLIGSICGIVTPTEGRVTVGGHDIRDHYRAAREMIGLVPQELTTDAFETVWATVSFSRGLFGKAPDPAYIEKTLKALSLWDKRDNKLMTLSGGMKRRVMIAKALSHEPRILFLDEPTAGVDVELRRDMWKLVDSLRDNGVTILLTTHYIEEAEEMADRIGIILGGGRARRGKARADAQARQEAAHRAARAPARGRAARARAVRRTRGRRAALVYTYDSQRDDASIAKLINALGSAGIGFRDLHTTQPLEDIFVSLIDNRRNGVQGA